MSDFTISAYPTFQIDGYGSSLHGILPNGDSAWCSVPGGFTKLEKASLMIAQGICNREFQGTYIPADHLSIAQRSVEIAKAILEEANK